MAKTAIITIITPFGLFKFLRLPFDLRNASQTFQRMMDNIFGDLPFCFIYLDDILVFSGSLEAYRATSLQCVRSLPCVQSLLPPWSHHQPGEAYLCCFSGQVALPLCLQLWFCSSSQACVCHLCLHTFQPILQQFLGMVNCYRKCIRCTALLLCHLTNALRGDLKDFSWMLRWTPPGPDWSDQLPVVMLGLRSTPRDELGFSTPEALYGAPLCLPGEFLDYKELPPSEFLERIQSAFSGLVLTPSSSPSSLCCLCYCCSSLRRLCVPSQGCFSPASVSALLWSLQGPGLDQQMSSPCRWVPGLTQSPLIH